MDKLKSGDKRDLFVKLLNKVGSSRDTTSKARNQKNVLVLDAIIADTIVPTRVLPRGNGGMDSGLAC